MNKTPIQSARRAWSRGLMRSFACFTLATVLGARASEKEQSATQPRAALRPPAVPLVTCDPYFSIWSPADKLTDKDTVHWTGKEQALRGRVIIDGKYFDLIGHMGAPPMPQVGLEVLPTRTIYAFAGQGIKLTLTFMTPALPDDVDILARPVTYITWDAQATDGKEHLVSFGDFGASPEIAVNDPSQKRSVVVETNANSVVTKIGSEDQAILARKGDDVRIDWGYFYMVTPLDFMSDRKVGSQPVSTMVILAYDDIYSIQYMKKNLRPYWRRNGWEAADLLKAAAKDYESLKKRCEAFDAELMADLRKVGGENYARLAALAYRQCFAAGKFVADANGQPIQFCKENHSNGCIGTSDVFYPMSPQFLLFGPTLAKSFLVPFMNYAASERWKFPFAPHDLGTYPQANGQVYGGGERNERNQMPVEESGNLLLLMGAIAQIEGNADFAGSYWKQVEQWAGYLKAKGFDPENQLCTDDFAGHLAHNVNLSAKAICGLGAFAKLCDLRGDKSKSDEYFKLAREFAQRWVKEADDGDHFRLAFDRPGTWSQKYNLMWDRILDLNLFPADVARKEMDYYRKNQNQFGLPLDNRKEYTKLDWITWTATLTQNHSDFEALIDPIIAFLNQTPNRSPMTDWYETKTAKKVGFTARPVVGGVFAQMLYDKALWKKWASRDRTKASNWAPIPVAPKTTAVIPAADTHAGKWRYTTASPATNWTRIDFDASSWKEGWGGFGTHETPGSVVGTIWNTRNIWLRREVEIPAGKLRDLQLWLHHDDDTEIYVNGSQVFKASGWTTSYDAVPLSSKAREAFKPGRNLIAIHCRQDGGGQYVDLGLVDVRESEQLSAK